MRRIPLATAILLAGSLAHAAPQETRAPETFVAGFAGEDGELSLAETRNALAAIELLVVVDRRLREAERNLVALRERLAARADGADVREASVLALLAHVELHLTQGQLEAAQAVIPEETAVALDPRVVEVREALARVRAGGPVEGSAWLESLPVVSFFFQDDKVEAAVEAALAKGDWEFVLQLGERSAPSLVRRVERDIDVLPQDLGTDPLHALVRVSPRLAAATMRRNMDAGGFFWKKRVLRVLAARDVFGVSYCWNNDTFPATIAIPDFLAVVEALVADPELAGEALGLLKHVVGQGALTPALEAAFVEALLSDEYAIRWSALQQLRSVPTYAYSKSLLERSVASPSTDVRRHVSAALTFYPWSDALAARVDDPDDEVRGQVLRMLKKRDLRVWDSPSSTHTVEFVPELGPRERALLARLTRDPDPNIRTSALLTMLEFPMREELVHETPGNSYVLNVAIEPLPEEALLRLMTDEDVDVRFQLATMLEVVPEELRMTLLVGLAADAEPRVAQRAIRSVRTVHIETRPDTALRILRILHDNPGVELTNIDSVWSRLKSTPQGIEAFARWVIETEDETLLLGLLSEATGRPETDGRIGELPADVLADLVEVVDRSSQWRRVLDLFGGPFPLSPGVLAAAERVAGTESVSGRARLWAALALGSRGGPAYRDAVASVLALPYWRDGDQGWSPNPFQEKLQRIEDGEINALVLAVVANEATDDTMAAQCAEAARAHGPGYVEASRAILARWFPDGGAGSEAVRDVVRAMAYVPEVRDDEVLAAAALTDEGTYSRYAIEAIGRLRDPALLPVLEEIVRNRRGHPDWHRAVQALPGFLSDEAAELLLQAASWAESEGMREFCLTQLEKIREFHLAQDYWTRRRALDRSRDSAVAELFQLLADDSEAVRVQAIRGLATFEAVEAIPTLIRLLKDPAEAIRREAETALERLQGEEVGG